MNNNHLSFPHIRPKNAGDNATVHETENTMSLISSSVTSFRAQKTGVHAVARGSNNVKVQGVHVGHAHDAVGDSKDPPKYYYKCMVCRKLFNSKQAVCGHMRMHPERTWRGLNPRESSTWKPHASPEFDLSVLAAPEAQEKALASDKFDLNLSAPETFLNFDLNKPALEEGDDNAY
nr:zinc finger protein zat2 [Quercus suber]